MADHDTFAVRPRRQVPPPKHPRPIEGGVGPDEDSTNDRSETEASPSLAPPPAEHERQRTRRTTTRPASTGTAPPAATDEHPVTRPSDPLANLAVRVRRPLDKRLGSLVYKLGEEEVKTSKAEVIEMLLWELPSEPSDDFRSRLAAFRRAAPRETPLT